MTSKRYWLQIWQVVALPTFLLYFGSVSAESVVTAIIKPTIGSTPLPYLHPGASDDGYIAISAQIDTPEKTACVTPTNAGNTDNYFTSRSLEVTIFAIIEGFSGIDPKQPVPLVNFKWNDKSGKYCTSPTVLPITLVPNHRFGLTGPTGAAQPRISLKLVYTSSEEEQISSMVNAWIGMAGAFSTGGAANTVVGLSSLAKNKAFSSLSDIYNGTQRQISDQVYPIELDWRGLYEIGAAIKKISFVQTDTKGWPFNSESIEAAINRIKANPNGEEIKPIFDVKLKFEYRRSLFVDDGDLNNKTYLPSNTGLLSADRILNFPNDVGIKSEVYPNLIQVINSRSPSIVAALRDDSGSKCSSVFSILRAIGLNGLDRALAINALLEDVRPKWRSEPDFYKSCFSRETSALKFIEEIYGDLAEAVVENNMDTVPIPKKYLASLVQLDKELLDRVSDIKESLMTQTSQSIRKINIAQALKAKEKMSWLYLQIPSPSTLDEQLSALSSIDFERMSCFHRFPSDDKNRIATVATVINDVAGKQEVDGYILSFDFAESKPREVAGVSMLSVQRNSAAESRFEFLKRIDYQKNSACKSLLSKLQ